MQKYNNMGRQIIIIVAIAVLLLSCSDKKEPWKPSSVCIKGLEYIVSYDETNSRWKVELTGYTCSSYEYTRGEYIKAEDETEAAPEDEPAPPIEEEVIEPEKEPAEDDPSIEIL